MMSSPERSWAISQPSAQQQQPAIQAASMSYSQQQPQQGVQQQIEMRQPMQQQVNQNQTSHTIHVPLNGNGSNVI
jgi:hypothetical protein